MKPRIRRDLPWAVITEQVEIIQKVASVRRAIYSFQIYEGTSQIQRMIIGRELFKG